MTVVILLSGVFVSGCATNRINLVDTNNVNAVKIGSSSTYISRFAVYSTDSVISVSGAVRKRIPSRGHIYGYVDVEVLSPDDNTLFSTTTGYHRRSRKSFSSLFTVRIPFKIEDGSTVRVTHHRAPRTASEKINKWCNQDQNSTEIEDDSRILDTLDLDQFT